MRALLLPMLVMLSCGVEPVEPVEPPVEPVEREPEPEPSVPEVGVHATLELAGDTVVRGEVIAVYDHAAWWTAPSDERTYALFDDDAFAAWPDDQSVRFVSSSDITRVTLAPIEAAPYREALRQRGFVLDQPPLDGVSWVITGHDGYHLEENGGGDFAWDLVRTDETGATFAGDGLENEDHFVWGSPVRLPSAGYVVAARDDLPDNLPGFAEDVSDELPCGTNNCVGIHLGGQYYLYLLHLREGSIPDEVVVGETLPAGALVGEVGNSGVSFAPHLHLSLLWYDEVGARSWSVPAEMVDLYWSEDGVDAAHAAHHDPGTGSWISAAPF